MRFFSSMGQGCGASIVGLSMVVAVGIGTLQNDTALAQTWDSAGGGSWNTGGNWSSNSVPSSGSTVVFPNLGGRYTVTFPDLSTSSFNLQTNGDTVFSLLGHEYLVSNVAWIGYATGATSRLEIDNGLLGARNSRIGLSATSNGTLIVDGATAGLYIQEIIAVGDAGTGYLGLSDGGDAQIDGQIQLAFAAGSQGTTVVNGTGSILSATLGVVVGGLGDGVFNVEAGGEVRDFNFTTVAFSVGSTGSLTVTGPGSKYLSAGGLTVGREGAASMTISDGGYATSGGIIIGRFTSLNETSTLTITGVASGGERSLYQNDGILNVGNEGLGELKVLHGGRLETTGPVQLGIVDGSRGTLKVGDSITEGVDAQLFASDMVVGVNGQGIVEITSGGEVNITNQTIVGRFDLDDESLVEVRLFSTLNAGTFLGVGAEGRGKASAYFGTINAQDIQVGMFSGSTGVLEADTGGEIVATNELVVGGVTANEGGDGTLLAKRTGVVRVAKDLILHKTGTIQMETDQSQIPSIIVGNGPLTPAPVRHSIDIFSGGTMTYHRDGTLVNVERIHIHDPAGGDDAVLQGSARIAVEVVNDGTVKPGTDFASVTNLPLFKAAMEIDGDYTQTASGRLVTPISAETKAGTLNIPLYVHGTPRLAGTIAYDYIGGYEPTLGDRHNIMAWDELANPLVGRFGKTENSTIDDDKFMALIYSEGLIQASVVETPRVFGGGANGSRLTANKTAIMPGGNLVFLAHGTASNADSWVQTLGNAMRVGITNNPGQWQVVGFDWRHESGSNILAALDAGNHAADLGEAVALWFEETGFAFNHIHAAGHSAGSWLVDGLADQLKKTGGPFFHLTLFDAFVPGLDLVTRVGSGPPILGDSADYAETIYDTRPQVPFTAAYLANMFNIDISPIYTGGSGDVVAIHGWPYVWYEETAHDPIGPSSYGSRFGFARSLEWLGGAPVHGTLFTDYPRGALVRVFGGGALEYYTPAGSLVVNLADHPAVTQGSVNFQPNGSVTLTTSDTAVATTLAIGDGPFPLQTQAADQEPAMLTSFIDLTMPANVLSFDFQFGNDAGGQISAFVNGDQVFIFQQDWVEDRLALYHSGMIWLPQTLEAGTQTLMFRIDGLNMMPSMVNVDNVTFSLFEVVPEPTSLAMLLVLAPLSLRRRRAAA